jgi:hypothetical protein
MELIRKSLPVTGMFESSPLFMNHQLLGSELPDTTSLFDLQSMNDLQLSKDTHLASKF